MSYRCTDTKSRTMEFVSGGCLELTGYRPSDLQQGGVVSYAQLIHPEDRERVSNEIQAASKESRPFQLEYRIVTANSLEKWVWERGRGVWSGEGERLALEGFITDVTESKLAEERYEQSLFRLRRILEGTVNALAATAERRDPYTAGHQKRVSQLSCAIARQMGLTEDQIEGIRVAATLHDMGKIYVPAEILNKPGHITEVEMSIIRAHPKVGCDILRAIEFPWPVAEIVLQHHERLNGSGYPEGLSGKTILLEARILGVADVVESMSSHRPYRPALGVDKALEEIAQNRGVLYDPAVVDACLEVLTNKGFAFLHD